MTGLDTDLATLRLIQREMADHPAFPVSSESMLAALDRVEAEIVRLRERTVRLETQQLSDALDLRDTEMEEAKAEITRLRRENADILRITGNAAAVDTARLEAAERELARLREGLRDMAASDATSPESLRSYARRLLAEDGAARSEDTPFTAPAVQSHERGLFERRKDDATHNQDCAHVFDQRLDCDCGAA